MDKSYLQKSKFIKEAFLRAQFNAVEYKTENDQLQNLTLFRKNNGSAFLLLTISNDFRETDWAISLNVGDGYPELADDEVVIQIA